MSKGKNAIQQIGNLYGGDNRNPSAGRIYSSDGISPTIRTCCGGNQMPIIKVGGHETKGKG